jgi:hypothetical protein
MHCGDKYGLEEMEGLPFESCDRAFPEEFLDQGIVRSVDPASSSLTRLYGIVCNILPQLHAKPHGPEKLQQIRSQTDAAH